MLVIPLRDENTPAGRAYVTFFLVLVNVLVYFGFQLHDDEAFAKAASFYGESSLAALELPRYASFLESEGRVVDASKFRADLAQRDEKHQTLAFYTAFSDGRWQQALAAHRVIPAGSAGFAGWQKDRQHFETLLRQSTAWRWGTIPAAFEPLSALTSMFLHGSFDHLLGNMIFLALIGYLVEPLLGSLRFLLFYLLSGFAAIGLFMASNPALYQPYVGASGAIAGIMGLYAVLYGLQRIRVFYWLVFYFGYRSVPALLLFPFWVAKEVFEKMTTPGSQVAYEAHIGGLLAGAALAGVFRWRHRQVLEEKQQEVKAVQDQGRLLQQAQLKARALDFAGALLLYEKLLAVDPGNTGLLLEAWRSARHVPGTAQDKVAAALLSATPSVALPVSAQAICFREFSKGGRALPLSPAQALKLALRFLKAGEIDGAEKLLLLLRPHADLPGSDMAWLQLVLGWRAQENPQRAALCEKYLRTRYPESVALQRLG